MSRPPKLYHDDILPDGSRSKGYDWELMDRDEELLDGWRREHAARVWQAMQAVLWVVALVRERNRLHRQLDDAIAPFD